MDHTDLTAGRSGDNINFRIDFRHGFFQYNHTEDGSAGRNISGTGTNAVGGCHAGTCVAFRRAEDASGFEISGRIKQSGAFSGEGSGIFSG